MTELNESRMIKIGGIEQYILVRGNDVNNPFILFLHGGPGSPLSPIASVFPKEIEEHFNIVYWDQRGAGKSFTENIPKDSMNIEQFIMDTNEVTDYIINTYDKEKIYLLGLSWGSVIGINAAHRYPEKYYAYIGMSQVVDMKKGEEISYDFLLDKVKEMGHKEAEEELKTIGRPPYKDEEEISIQRKWLVNLGFAERKISSPVLYTENCTNEELQHIIKGIGFTEATLVDEILDYNIYDLDQFEIPIYICMGKYDYQTPFELAEDYFKSLKAPHKAFFWFEESAHATALEEPDRLVHVLLTVLNETKR